MSTGGDDLIEELRTADVRRFISLSVDALFAWVFLLEPHEHWLGMQRELPQRKKGTTIFVDQNELLL
jgi:hypothetical protein